MPRLGEPPGGQVINDQRWGCHANGLPWEKVCGAGEEKSVNGTCERRRNKAVTEAAGFLRLQMALDVVSALSADSDAAHPQKVAAVVMYAPESASGQLEAPDQLAIY